MLRYIILLYCFLTVYAKNKAIVALNMQNIYCKEDSLLFVEGCTDAISNMNYLFGITQDDNVFSITTSNMHQNNDINIEIINDIEQFTLKDDIELIDDLYIPKSTKHFYMTKYSIAKDEIFIHFLEINKIKDIVLGGIHINNSIKDLVALEYNVYIYLPAVGFLSVQDKKNLINEWINIGININFEP
jgi:nicotinamidase-related amidase